MGINRPNLKRGEICSFEIVKLLGTGYFAKTYLVKDSDDLLALKVNDYFHDRLISEINFMTIIKHPHIICKKDFYTGEECGTNSFSFLMEYCPVSIEKIIGTHYYTFEQLLKYFYQLLSCVHFLFINGFSHNDIYSKNICIDKYDNIKLLDLGIMSEINVFGRKTNNGDFDHCKYFFLEMVKAVNEIGTEKNTNFKNLYQKKLKSTNPFFKNHNKKVLRSFLRDFYEAEHPFEIMKNKIFDPFRNIFLENYSLENSPKLYGYSFDILENNKDIKEIKKYFEKSIDWFYSNSDNFSIKLLFLYLENYIRILNIKTKLSIKQIDLYSKYLSCAYYNVKFISIIREEIKVKVLYDIIPKLQGIIGENRVLKKCKSIEDIVKYFNIICNNITETDIYENIGPNYYMEIKISLGCRDFLETYYYK